MAFNLKDIFIFKVGNGNFLTFAFVILRLAKLSVLLADIFRSYFQLTYF